MIIDPQSYVPLEVSRRLAAAEDAFALGEQRRSAQSVRRSTTRRRGLALRLVSMVVGRTAHV